MSMPEPQEGNGDLGGTPWTIINREPQSDNVSDTGAQPKESVNSRNSESSVPFPSDSESSIDEENGNSTVKSRSGRSVN